MSKTIQFHIGMIIAAAFFLLISYLPYKSSVRALQDQHLIEVEIDDVSCRSYKSKSGFYFYYKEKYHHVDILGKSCNGLRDGDSYKLLYDKEGDKFKDLGYALMIRNRLKYYIIFFLLTLIPYPLVYRKFFKK